MSSVPARVRASAGTPASGGQAGLALLAFFGLAAFAAVRYSSLIATPPAGRAVLVAACVTAGCALIAATGHLAGSGPALALLRLVLVLGTFALSMLALHVPAHLLAPGQWHHLADRVSTGTHQLSGWLWPYRGASQWAQVAVLLPVPALLLLAGCAWFWPSRTLLATRRTLALAALLAIFVTGTANAPASVPAFDGVVLMALLAATLLAPLTAATEVGRALCWLAACAGVALAVQAVLRSDGPWIHYREPSAAASTAIGGVTFQWAQLYGPDRTPHTDAPMLLVFEQRPELLRLTSLDRFDGLRFLRSSQPPGSRRLDVPRATASRWIESATVEVAGLRSTLLASGGVATRVRSLNGLEPAPAGRADGTTFTPSAAARGARYEVVSYDPHPSAQDARRAPRTYPRAYLPYTQLDLPAAGASALVAPNLGSEALAAPADARLVGPSAPGRRPASEPGTRALIEASPYGPMFALARGLARGARSDYEVAQHVERYLQSTYAYDRTVPLTRYPLESFLFSQRRGYCQQFSGAMTLMLRMDGIPARVGVGFLPSVRGTQPGSWQIRASDAHAWTEVFLSGIGWVSFDPTPPTGAGEGVGENTAVSRTVVFGRGSAVHTHHERSAGDAGPAHRTSGGGAGSPLLAALGLGLGAMVALCSGAYALRRRRRRRPANPGEDPAVAELRRALVRLGQAEPGLTLAQLERRLTSDGHARAAAYVGAVRARRFGAGTAAVSARPKGRGALRRALAPTPGPGGLLRALVALPPARPAWLTRTALTRHPRGRAAGATG